MSEAERPTQPFLPYGRQLVEEDDLSAVAEALRSDWLTTGPAVERFERRLAEAVGARYAVAVNSGTAALHAAYFAAGVGPGDEVVTSPLTFAATANAALYLGARPVFVDVEEDTGNLDPSRLAAALSGRAKVIAPVDFAGHPCELEPLLDTARRRGLTVVEDAAHALGAKYRGKNVGSLAHMTVFSFHPVKHITTGEGGAVVTDDESFYHRLQAFRTHGIVRGRAEMLEDHGPWYYEMHHLGYNYRITDFQCALGSSQLQKLPRFLQRRREIVARYQEAFADLPGVRLPVERPEVEAAWHLYVLRLADGATARRRVFERLRQAGLGVQVHYIPVYWHPYYRRLGFRKGLCPRAEEFYAGCLSLPLFPAMGKEDVERTIAEVRRAVLATTD